MNQRKNKNFAWSSNHQFTINCNQLSFSVWSSIWISSYFCAHSFSSVRRDCFRKKPADEETYWIIVKQFYSFGLTGQIGRTTSRRGPHDERNVFKDGFESMRDGIREVPRTNSFQVLSDFHHNFSRHLYELNRSTTDCLSQNEHGGCHGGTPIVKNDFQKHNARNHFIQVVVVSQILILGSCREREPGQKMNKHFSD
jgi:hypothetical protein